MDNNQETTEALSGKSRQASFFLLSARNPELQILLHASNTILYDRSVDLHAQPVPQQTLFIKMSLDLHYDPALIFGQRVVQGFYEIKPGRPRIIGHPDIDAPIPGCGGVRIHADF